MKPSYPKFGIVSGAGPMAGALLYQRVTTMLQEKGAWKDGDFPFITLINVPFSEMLDGNFSCPIIKNELITTLSFLHEHADYTYIACQTLHAFLTAEEVTAFGVVSLLHLIQQASQSDVNETQNIHIVASKTSRLFNLHGKAINKTCIYIEHERSERAIDAILKGDKPELGWLETLAQQNPVLLGCTEFSVALQDSSAPFIDPIQLAANDIVQRFLSSQ